MGFFEEVGRRALFKPCAHCGSTSITVKNDEHRNDCSSLQVMCKRCGARTRRFRFITGDDDSRRRAMREASSAWNMRADSLI